MRRHLAVPLALLFIAFGVPSNAQSNPVESTTAAAAAAVAPVSAAESSAGDSSRIIQYYLVSTIFMLNCTTARVADAGSYVWKKNDTVVEQLWDLRQRYKLEDGGAVFRMSERTNENDFGNYSCSVGTDSTPVFTWDVRGRPIAKMPPNANVVEKQSIKLTCKIMGKPYPTVEWTVSNTTEEKGPDVKAVLGERVKIQDSEQGVENGELVLSEAERSDAGVYKCTPLGVPDAVAASTTLRVKDQYAALWPFLGICAEVFVLCAIILVYEKRRTKPELDDSDTDNHDQKKS